MGEETKEISYKAVEQMNVPPSAVKRQIWKTLQVSNLFLSTLQSLYKNVQYLIRSKGVQKEAN